jgi:hypothetical protein
LIIIASSFIIIVDHQRIIVSSQHHHRNMTRIIARSPSALNDKRFIATSSNGTSSSAT